MKDAKKVSGPEAFLGNDIKWNFGKFLIDGKETWSSDMRLPQAP